MNKRSSALLNGILEPSHDPKTLGHFELLFWMSLLLTLHLEGHLRGGLGTWSDLSLWMFLSCALLVTAIVALALAPRKASKPATWEQLRTWFISAPTRAALRVGSALSFSIYAHLKTEQLGLRHDESILALSLWLLAFMGVWARRSVQFLIAALFVCAGFQKALTQFSWWWSGEAVEAWLRWSNFLYIEQHSAWQRELNHWLLQSNLSAWLGPGVVLGEIAIGVAALSRRAWPFAACGALLMLISFRSVLYVPFSLLIPLLIYTSPWPNPSTPTWPQRGSGGNDEDETTMIQGTA